jgi:hypothetical protein
MKKVIKILAMRVKSITNQCIINIIRKLSEFELWLNRHDNPNPNGYEDLTPTNKGDDDRKYSVALEWALKNENIKNIALTGAYGSGKSSIIRTFEKEHQGYNYLNISLASFSDNIQQQDTNNTDINSQDIKNTKESNIDRLIELSILQQMFYHVQHKTIPDSRFKRIKSIGGRNLGFKTLGFIIWILALILFFKPKFLQETAIWKELDLSSSVITYLLPTIILLGIGAIIARIIRIANNSKLNKLNVQSGEIEISKDLDSSILNKHLDEILYFFEVTKYNVVILEDLDRFNNPDIFTKLRELNILINSSKQINRRVVFIYAIKDDMFHDKNRTKFFDFIIPVIPIINPSNSGAMLHNMLLKAKTNNISQNESSLSPDLIDDVSFYIDDMRLLKNICNEYTIYKEKLSSKLNHDYLLSMIIYKNIFPSDFVDLHNGKGKVFAIFDSKSTLIKDRTDRITTEIGKLKKDIEDIEDICLNNIQELRAVYIDRIINKLHGIDSFFINNKEYNFSEIKEDTLFELLIKANKIGYYVFQHNSYNGNYRRNQLQSDFSFKDIEKEIDTHKTYQEREQLVQDKYDNKIEKLKKHIEELKAEKNEIKSWTLQQIAEKIGLGNSFEKIKNEKLIVYLIRNGYINENYHDYISYFHEGLITKADREFRFSILNHEALPFDYKLTKVENLIKKIRPKEFESKEVLNSSLVDFLLSKREVYNEQYQIILKQLCSKNTSAIAFIDCFIEQGLHIDLFIISLCVEWNTFWDFIVLESGYSNEKKDNYLKLILEYVDIDTILLLNSNNNLSTYLSNKLDFLIVFSNGEKIQKLIKSLNIKFKKLEYPNQDCELFDFIYENDLYEVNKDMIDLIVKTKNSVGNIDKLNTANYTTIKTSGCDYLSNYIENNLDKYISDVFLTLPENMHESEKFIIDLLCREEDTITIDNRKKIIEKQATSITNLSILDEIEHSLLEFIIEKSKMLASWENVIFYYELKEENIDNVLIKFLNQENNFKELSKCILNKNSDKPDEFIKKLSLALILHNKLQDNSFEYLMKSIPYTWNRLNFENLSKNKTDWMVSNCFLTLTTDNYNLLKAHFKGKHIDLIKKHSQKFIETQTDYTLDKDDLMALLDSLAFNQQQKVSIIQNADKDIIIDDKELSNIICNILAVYQYIELEFDILKNLIRYGRQMDNNLKLFNLHFDTLNDEQITVLLNVLGEPYSDIASKGKRPSLSKNQLNLEFVNKLKSKDYISSFKEKDDRIKVNTKSA